MILGILPTVDYAFKHLFGRDTTKPLLINLLNAVLNTPPGHRIEDVDIMNPFNPKETLDDKLSILDIKARDQAGWQFNIEMQMLAFRYYEKRILYYWAKLHQQQLHEGEDYLLLKPTISISFLDHVLVLELPDYHLRFRLLEQTHHLAFTEDIEFHTLELPKFTKSAAEPMTALDVWLYFLRYAATMDTDSMPAVMQQPMMVRAVEELKMLSQTDQERERYEARRKFQLDYNTGMKVARMEGHEEGREEGRKESQTAAKIDMIHAFEDLLGRPHTPSEQLSSLSLEELTRLADELKRQLLNRR